VRDLAADTAVTSGVGGYTATIVKGWDIWGPQGGYVAGIALRAAGAAASFPRPVSFACQFLRPAQVGAVDANVESLKRTKRTESLRVTLSQEDVPLLGALVWTTDEFTGIDHDA
jgi:hypothetical protein